MLAPEWAEQAACRDEDHTLFFPHKNSTYVVARAICARCPVVDECLTFALEAEGYTSASWRAGMFGGLSPKERYEVADRTRTCERCGVLFRAARPARVCAAEACKKWVRQEIVARNYDQTERWRRQREKASA